MKLISLSTKDFQRLTVNQLRIIVNDYYNDLKGKKIVNKHKNLTIEFIRKGQKKTAFGTAINKEKVAVIMALPQILINAQYNNFGQPKTTDSKSILGYLNFKTKVKIDNKISHYRVSVIVMNTGKFHYSLSESYIKKEE